MNKGLLILGIFCVEARYQHNPPTSTLELISVMLICIVTIAIILFDFLFRDIDL